MNRQTPGKHFASFYRGKTVPAETAARLKALALADLQRSGEVGVKPRRGPLTKSKRLLLAGVLALLPASAWFLWTASLSVTSPGPTKPAEASEMQAESPASDAAAIPNLVAVRYHADWCPKRSTAAYIYGKLQTKYAHRPVHFVTLDISNDETRREGIKTATALGIDWIAPDMEILKSAGPSPYVGGLASVIKLVDRERREVLATVTQDEHLHFDNVLNGALR